MVCGLWDFGIAGSNRRVCARRAGTEGKNFGEDFQVQLPTLSKILSVATLEGFSWVYPLLELECGPVLCVFGSTIDDVGFRK